MGAVPPALPPPCVRLAQAAQELLPIIQGEPTLRYGSYGNSMEEYAEAVVFRLFLEEVGDNKQGQREGGGDDGYRN